MLEAELTIKEHSVESEEFLPFSKPCINQAAIDEVIQCLKSGWITTGPRVQKFEHALAQYLQAPYAAVLSSATAGLHLALLSLNLQPGDEVITSPLTFVATLNTIVLTGAKPVLVDVDETYNMDVSLIEKAITPHTKAILPVHFTGLPVDLDPIYALASQHNLRVIEDAAQAIGSKYKDRILGSFGDTQVFSFHPGKNMTTGEGGCVTSRDKKLMSKLAALRFHGIDKTAWDRYGKKGNQDYDVILPGYKYNMMDMQAALGIHQLASLEDFIARRAYLAHRYQQLLAHCPALNLPKIPNYSHRHSWHLFTILINPEEAHMDRNTFMKRMNEQNIGLGLHYNPPHLYTFYQNKFGFRKGDFPLAESIGSRILSLPLFPDLSEKNQDRVIAAINHVLKN